jgi:heptosyltransferase II
MKKIGILQTAFLGDTALIACMIDKIEELYGSEAEIHLILKKGLEDLFQHDKRVKSIITFDKRKKQKGLHGIFKTIKKIRKLKLDVLFNAHRSFRSTIVSIFGGAKKLIGFKEAVLSILFNTRLERKGKHEVIKNHLLLEAYDSNFKKLRPEEKGKYKLFTLKEKDLPKLSELTKEPFIMIAPGSKWPTKRWKKEGFLELSLAILENTNYDIVFTGDKYDKNIIDYISSKIPKKYQNRINKLSENLKISELMFIISKARIVISNDSAPQHIACGFDVAVLSIFGPTTKELGYYPYGEDSSVVEAVKVSCRPCGLHGHISCPKKTHECMESINVQDVWLALAKYL